MTASDKHTKPRRANYLEIIAHADTETDLIDFLLLIIEQLRCESSGGMQTKSMIGYDAKIYHEKKDGPTAAEYQHQLTQYKMRVSNENRS